MGVKILKSVNFGRRYTGLDTVGYTLETGEGDPLVARTTTGVYEIGTNTGTYAVLIDFADDLDHANVLWDTGTSTEDKPLRYATEQYNRLENNPGIDDINVDVKFLRAITAGRWSINEETKQMVFYDEDNTTVIAKFSLYGRDGLLAYDAVFSRIRNDGGIILENESDLLDAL